MPRSPKRKTLDIPTPLYDQLAAEADRRGQTTASLATEYLYRALPNTTEKIDAPMPTDATHQEVTR